MGFRPARRCERRRQLRRPLRRVGGACPARRAQRKGVVEAAIKYLTRSWWRTAAVTTIGDAQRGLDAWSACVADQRKRPDGTVGELGAAEPLRLLPSAPYPARIAVERTVSRAALTAFEGNQYSMPPGHAGTLVTVIAQVAQPVLRIVSAHGEIVAEHRRIPPGAGQTVRSADHAALLEAAVLAAFTTKDACRRKQTCSLLWIGSGVSSSEIGARDRCEERPGSTGTSVRGGQMMGDRAPVVAEPTCSTPRGGTGAGR